MQPVGAAVSAEAVGAAAFPRKSLGFGQKSAITSPGAAEIPFNSCSELFGAGWMGFAVPTASCPHTAAPLGVILSPATSHDFNPIFCIFIVNTRRLKPEASSEALQLLPELFYTAANK